MILKINKLEKSINEQVLQHVHERGEKIPKPTVSNAPDQRGEHGSVSYISITSDDDNDDFNRDNSATPSILYSDRPLIFAPQFRRCGVGRRC